MTWLLRLFRRTRLETELDKELAYHIDRRVADLMAQGLDASEAARQASVEFGHDEIKEACRDARGTQWLENVFRDAAYALRMLRRSPGLAIVAIVTVAVGVGAGTSMFSLLHSLVLAPPPHVEDPDRVVRLHQFFPPGPGEDVYISPRTSYAFYDFLSPRVETLASLAAYTDEDLAVGTGSQARMTHSTMVSAGFWATLGARPALGRFILDEEAHPATGARVVVLGHAYWQREFGGDPDVLGRALQIKGQPYEIIGVAPRGFRGIELADVDLWLPFFVSEDGSGEPVEWHTIGASFNLNLVARLKEGTAADRAAEELTTYQRVFLVDTYRETRNPGLDERNRSARILLGSISGGIGEDLQRIPEARLTIWLVGIAVVLLCVACLNVAGLLLLRAMRRRREVAVRLALGVTRGRLASQLLTESLVLAFLGGIAALILVVTGSVWLQRTILPAMAWEPAALVNVNVLAVAAICILGTAAAAGMAPLHYTTSQMDAHHGGLLRGRIRRPRLQAVLLTAQCALSVVLLVGAGLFLRSLHKAETADIGLDRDGVFVASIDFSGTQRNPAEIAAFYERALERVSNLPGVSQASLALSLPLRSARGGGGIRVAGRDVPAHANGAYVNYVTPGFFTTTGMRVREGREFLPHERNRDDVVVVNETMAEYYWPGQSPVGQCLYFGRNPACRTVIGVVADARRFNLIEEERYVYYYRPLVMTDMSSRSLLVRVAPGTDGMDDVLHQVLQEVDPNVPFIQIETIGEALDPQIRQWRLGASVFTAFGILAVLLAVVGLSSSIGYAVSQRTHEFAVRLAIGATPRMLIRLMLKSGIWNALVATAIGLGTAALAGDFIADLLYETSPYDPLVFVAVAVIVIIAAAIASLIPAWRVARIDPALALRAE